MKILLSKPACIGCASCVDIAPAYFFMDLEGKASLYGENVAKKLVAIDLFQQDQELIQDVIDCCPSKCIELR